MKRILTLSLYLIVLLTTLSCSASAQFESVEIGVNGLTCSQCSRTVELSLRKLDFVADVAMNLQHTTGKITFKKNSWPDMDKIAQAVINAGFSVRYLIADLSDLGNQAELVDKDRFDLDHSIYVFPEAPPKDYFNGHLQLKFLGKKFLPKADYKKTEPSIARLSDIHNSMGKVYFVQLIHH